MKLYNVVDFKACATSALRDAKNGAKIIKHIKQVTGIPIEIISGEEEARTIYDNHIERLLISSANAQEDGNAYLYVDVGGGSTEISCIAHAVNANAIIVPTIGLADGIINKLASLIETQK